LKVDGVATVPSRRLQRLTALAERRAILCPDRPWAWGRARDKVANFTPVQAPKPSAVDARPRKLSVTRTRMDRKSYEISPEYSQLEPLKPLGLNRMRHSAVKSPIACCMILRSVIPRVFRPTSKQS
jgi:hypothetical protein